LTGAVVDWQGPLVQPLVVLAAFGGAGFVSTRMESRVRERALSMLDWLRSWAVMLLFFLAPLAVFAVLLWQLPAEFNWTVLWMVLGAAAVVLVLTLGGSLAVARWIGLLHAPTDRLNVIVDRAVERVGAPRPTVFVLHWKVANALAFPFGRSVAVTDTALDSLADEELVAICVHELAHLTEPRRIHLLRLAAQFAWLPLFLVGPLSGALGSAGYPLALGSTLIAHLLVRRMVLAMEVRADAAGKSHEGEAGTYARALERLYQINLMPAVTRHRRPTHPHLYDRLLTAGITPDYPRPKPPSRWRSLLAIGFLIVASVFCALMTAALLTSA
jgi:Zn-dependent protease with chaperone function